MTVPMRLLLVVLAVCACSGPNSGGGGGADAGRSDARAAVDAAATIDVVGGNPDAPGVTDARPVDAAPVDATPVDATPVMLDAASTTDAIHILIDNFCNTSTRPTEVTAALNSGLMLTFHNDSVDYQADVWSSRGYGYLELATGGTWDDPVRHCDGPQPYTETFEVSITGGGSDACPSATFSIHCQ
jgi:hypothetical protein